MIHVEIVQNQNQAEPHHYVRSVMINAAADNETHAVRQSAAQDSKKPESFQLRYVPPLAPPSSHALLLVVAGSATHTSEGVDFGVQILHPHHRACPSTRTQHLTFPVLDVTQELCASQMFPWPITGQDVVPNGRLGTQDRHSDILGRSTENQARRQGKLDS